MLRPMEIPVNVTQITQATNAMAALAAQTRNVGQAARQVAAGTGGGSAAAAIRQQAGIQAARTNAAAQQIRAQGQLQAAQIRAAAQQVRAQSALARAQAPPAAALSSNPFLRVGQAQQNLQALQAAGAPRAAIQGAQYQLALAQRAQQRAQSLITPPSQSQRIAQAILTSRFGAGGLMPLVGRTMAAAGLTGAAAANAAIGVGAVGAATFAVQRFGRFLNEAADRAHQFAIAATISGGSGAQIASLRGMGVSTGEIGGAAAGLRGRITSDPIAAMTAMSLGTGPVLPRPFGATNEAAMLQTALQGLRNITALLPATATATQRAAAAETQLRKARILGLESYLDQLNVSNDVWNRGQRLGGISARINDARSMQAVRDIAGEQRNLETGLEGIRGATAKPFYGPMKTYTGAAANAAGATAKALDSGIGQNVLKGIIAATLYASMPIYGPAMAAGFLKHQDTGGRGGGTADPHMTAQEANTKAMEALAQILAGLRQDLGGGPRARGTLGGRLTGEAERRAMEANAVRVGPWAR